MNTRQNAFRHSQMVFTGKPLAAGIAHSKAHLLKRVDLKHFRRDKHLVDLVSSELARLDYAVHMSKEQILRFMRTPGDKEKDQSHLIFEAELPLFEDPAFISSIKETIERTGVNGESVLAEEIARLRDKAYACTDEFLEKSLITMQDLYYRLLYNMLPSKEDRIASLLRMPAGSILVADRLAPVEVAIIPLDKVLGILIEESAGHSHSSIMVRALGVPAVIDLAGIGSLIDESTDVLIDAYGGHVYLNPSEKTITECFDIREHHKAAAEPAEHPSDASVVTSADGETMHIQCNASSLADVLQAHNHGISGIGLFRSEMRYLTSTDLPSDGQEAAYYAGIFGVEGIGSITVRLLDLGGDKLPVYLQMAEESDPQLGCRGIRFLLSRPDLMKKQIRAILTSRGTFDVRLLLPLVTTVDDIAQSREILQEVIAEMAITGNIPLLGIMVEVPSVALSIGHFLPKVDFVSLGTNDLMQYFFAANRDQSDLQKYNRFTHPAFLKMLAEVIAACEEHPTPLTVCGEMASDPLGCCLLAAMGATTLSVQPDAVVLVSQAIVKQNVAALKSALPGLFALESADEVERKICTIDL